MMTLMKRCEQKIVSDYVSCKNKIDIVETYKYDYKKLNAFFFCVWTIFSELWLSSIKYFFCRNDDMRLFGLRMIWSQKLSCPMQWRIFEKFPFCSRTLEKNVQFKNQNCRWNPELIKIDLFLELGEFGQVYTNLDKFKPIRGEKCTNHIKS